MFLNRMAVRVDREILEKEASLVHQGHLDHEENEFVQGFKHPCIDGRL